MSTSVLLSFVLGYFGLLLVVAYFTSKKSNNDSFFIGNRNSNWMLVAFGMIGTSLSGVTFVSVPGLVGTGGFQYFQVVIGYFLGYLVVAFVLLPLYYKLQLTSIYSYLNNRIGTKAHKTGSMFFIVSRTLGATARLYLVVNILQLFILDKMGIPFWLTTLVILLLILLYTVEGGVKTIVYTDMLQTSFMLLGLVVCIIAILNQLDISFSHSYTQMQSLGFTKIFNTDVKASGYFLKQIIGGAFITIAMTGLDQEMMQKNISVSNLKNAQKNMLSYSTILVFINFLFLMLGGCLYLFAAKNGITTMGDDLFPTVALGGTLATAISILFIIGLISALFPSADGALTALTSSFCIDILGIKTQHHLTETQQSFKRKMVHLSFAVLFFICVMVFKYINDKSIIDFLLKIATYTYGPLLGLFVYGIYTNKKINDPRVPYICIVAPILAMVLDVLSNADWFIKKLKIQNTAIIDTLTYASKSIFNGYKISIELLIINGLITFVLLIIFSKKKVY